MIKIVNGTYGYRNPVTGMIEAKNSKSKPFNLSPDREEELVSAGVAEYVGEDEEEPEVTADKPEYSDANTVAELKAIASKKGLKVSEKATKKQLLKELDAADSKESEAEPWDDEEEADEDVESGDAPNISAELPE